MLKCDFWWLRRVDAVIPHGCVPYAPRITKYEALRAANLEHVRRFFKYTLAIFINGWPATQPKLLTEKDVLSRRNPGDVYRLSVYPALIRSRKNVFDMMVVDGVVWCV